jgi:uncharacterized membrane protein YkoI
MKGRLLLTLTAAATVLLALAAKRSDAQSKVHYSGGDVTRSARGDAGRLATRIPGVDDDQRARLQVSGDSAQRIAMNDFAWRGRVSSVEIDEEDARLFWDVKIVPDTSQQTIIRYRVDATNGGILGIKEFSGVRTLVRRRP